MRNKKVLYYGWIGHNNIGDEALLEANKKIFRDFRFVRCDSRFSACHRIDACVLGGGTYINEKVSVAKLEAIQSRMPLTIFGVGVQNNEFWSRIAKKELAQKEWNSILDKCRFVSVRGPMSRMSLVNQGYDKAKVIGDPVLSLADSKPKNKHGRRVGICVGNTQNLLWGNSDHAVNEFFIDLAAGLLKLGYSVSLISVYPDDIKAAESVQSGIDITVERHRFFRYSQRVLEYFRGLDVFVGQKLHSVILAHCAYTPAIMIEYQPKCYDYMSSMGLEKLNYRSDRLDAEAVLDAIEILNGESADHQELLMDRITKYKNEQAEFAAEIVNYVRSL
ncbi:MAG TPA: polysaccharide pyruvyl transferase family protein [bacterium]|nr:polysaccharide pyruvyl transferase family protein [bacterium]